ncbi:type I-C CRISPR-associated protein Cas8c/Csd1 [Tindallia californiensis]|uniref:CRISPR-associated protein, Csd1 family n=1 Tax=Tindallia californiensis TaxID=159292 RepID=A0A1H3RB66_9FIRM|nr:type I-C CRISPR-associated protein Cas8c/Csd1 [Tindallia californiensis]SDZ22575.1 CRISPR-associated protein, Csd1 family [Tindallia californiensis]
MSWIQKLYDTYETNKELAGRIMGEGSPVLLPICHTTQRAHITVTLDKDGNYKRATLVAPEDSRTIIPCTEKSAFRVGTKPQNHPLADSLQYVAGDFVDFGGKVTSGFSKKPQEPYLSYREELGKWCCSEHANPKVINVFKYVQKGTLIGDLVNDGILCIENNGMLLETWAKDDKDNMPELLRIIGNDQPQSKALIRWAVEIPGERQSELWKDESVYDSWINYYIDNQTLQDICYVTGETSNLAQGHPAKIRNQGDSAKLISSNDTSGYTYRGRFKGASEAAGVSFEVTQKAHNALRWLIEKQGVRSNDLVILTWAVEGFNPPNPADDTASFMAVGIEEKSSYTADEFSESLRKSLYGYQKQLESSRNIMIMMMDSATPGRLSIRLYREMLPDSFVKRVENWHIKTAWIHRYRGAKWTDRIKEAVPEEYVSAPSAFDIAEAVYGKRIDDNLRKKALERIVRCLLDGQKIPRDMMEAVIRRACNPVGFEASWEWMKALTVACSMYRNVKEEEGYALALEEKRRSRDYLYGRLLALADSLEEWALREGGEKRQTNALRLMQRFSERPFSTWRNIELSLAPYKARLGGKGKGLTNRISEVMELFDSEDFVSDKKLSGEFLLGYHCQKRALWKKEEVEQEQTETIEGGDM